MSNHNIGFYEDLTKIIFELSSISSNTHLISSAAHSFQNFSGIHGLKLSLTSICNLN